MNTSPMRNGSVEASWKTRRYMPHTVMRINHDHHAGCLEQDHPFLIMIKTCINHDHETVIKTLKHFMFEAHQTACGG